MNAATDATSTTARRLKIAAIIVAIICLPVTVAVLIASVKGTR